MDFTAAINARFAELGFDDLDAYDIADLGGHIVITDTQIVSVYRSAEGVYRWLQTVPEREDLTLDDLYQAIHPNLVEDIGVVYDGGFWRQDQTAIDEE